MMNRIYIPSKDKDGRPLGVIADRFAKQARHLLARRLGGFTAYQAAGGWLDRFGEIIEEPVTVLESCGTLKPEQVEEVRELARQWCSILNQEAIMVMIASLPEFVDANQPA